MRQTWSRLLLSRTNLSCWITLAMLTPILSFMIEPHHFMKSSLRRGSVLLHESSCFDEFATTEKLFAWITRAIHGDDRYDCLDVAMAAIFDEELEDDSEPIQLLEKAMNTRPTEHEPCGIVISRRDRELNSLGPLGAGQWSGQTGVFPHSLLVVSNITNIGEWEQSLRRTCRQNIRKARTAVANMTVSSLPIHDGVAPHSTLAHFRCIVEHQVRLQQNVPGGYFTALCEAVGRFVATTRMAGTIYEIRNSNGDVLAFLHEVRKGRTARGQWFYATDEGSKQYVWFHCVHSLVERALGEKGRLDVVDLGPNGLDGKLDEHANLKSRYGFILLKTWPMIADYRGPFW